MINYFFINSDQFCFGNKFKGKEYQLHSITDERCIPCGKNEDIEVSWGSECVKCPNRKIIHNSHPLLCVLDCPKDTFESDDRVCYSCDLKYSIETSEEKCLKCSSRVYENGYCILKNCPEGTFRSDRSCVPCDDEYRHSFVEETECLKCSNREIVKDGKWTYCASKCEGKCRSANGLDCYECGDCFFPSPYIVSEEECSKCPNRRMENGLCIPKRKCP